MKLHLFAVTTPACLFAGLLAPNAVSAPLEWVHGTISGAHPNGSPAPIQTANSQDAGEEQYRFVAGLFSDGHWELTVKEATQFLKQHSNHPKATLARYRLAASLFELERKEESAKHFRALAQDANFEFAAEVNLRLGQCDLDAGRLESARKALRAARSGNKDYLKTHATFLLAEVEFRSEQFAEAKSLYAQSIALDGEGDTVLYAKRSTVWCDFRLDSYREASNGARAFLKEAANSSFANEIRFVLGESLTKTGDLQAAIEAYGAIETGEFHEAALRGRAFAYAAATNHPAAASEFANLLTTYPKGRFAQEATLHCGAHLLESGQAAQALNILAEPKDSKDPELLYWRAKATSQVQAKEAALPILEKALGLSKSEELTGRIQALRGELLYALGRLDESAAAFESAQSDYTLHAAASAHLAGGRPREAQRMAERLLREFPDSPYLSHAQQTRAEALFALEDYEASQAIFAGFYQDETREPGVRSQGLSRYAWCRYLQADLTEARNAFDRVLAEFPKLGPAEEACHMAARCAFEADDMEGANSRWTQYIDRFDGGPNLDQALLGLSRTGAGAQPLQRLIEELPDSPVADSAHLELARQWEAAGEAEQAARIYGQLLKRFPQSPHRRASLYGSAWCHQQLQRSKEAMASLQALLQEPEQDEWRTAGAELLVWCAVDLGDLETARQTWNWIAQSDLEAGRQFACCKKLAAALQANKQSDIALATMNAFAEGIQEPEWKGKALVETVWIALDSNNLEAATQQARSASKLLPDGADVAEAAFFVGEGHWTGKDLEQASYWYEKAAKAKDSQVVDQALYKLGFTRILSEDPKGAAKAFRQITDNFPKSPLHGESQYLLGESLLRSGDAKGATVPLQALLESQPKHAVIPKALFRLGQALQQTGKNEEAQSVLAKLVRTHGEFEAWAEAELVRGECLMALSRKREARAAFDRVLTRDKGVISARARLQIGRWHMDQEDHESALSEFLKVALLYAHPEEVAEAMYRAGNCLEQTDDWEAAKKQYRDASKKHPKTVFGKKSSQRTAELAK